LISLIQSLFSYDLGRRSKLMNGENSAIITNNNFEDLILDEFQLQRMKLMNPDIYTKRINNQYSVAYFPREKAESNLLYEYGFDAIPKCFGLMTYYSNEAVNIAQSSIDQNAIYKGQGVLLGFVDTGIDYRNKAFQNPDGTTRILSIWDQGIESGPVNNPLVDYGTIYSTEQINTALKSNNPLDIVPSIDDVGHGTALAGVAGGSYAETNNFSGVASLAEFLIVKLKPAKPYIREFFFLPEDVICYQEDDIMFGINYLVETARALERPIVICIGMGTSQGSHSGDGIFHNFLSAMGRYGDVSIVVAAGNEGNRNHHYYGELNPAVGYNEVEINIGEDEPGVFVEFWGNSPNIFYADIYAPTGDLVARVPTVYRQTGTEIVQYQETTIYIDSTIDNFQMGDQFILFRVRSPISGVWKLLVYGVGNLYSSFHMWLPIYNFTLESTQFLNPNQYTTITNPGNEETVLTVTAYNEATMELYYFASRGYTKENHPKPDITASGVGLLAAVNIDRYLYITGTGAAAAYTTGSVAIVMEWGIVRGNLTSLPSAKIRSMIVSGATRSSTIEYPNPDWGFGILNVSNSIRISRT
jgi:subtilisin family serine protease